MNLKVKNTDIVVGSVGGEFQNYCIHVEKSGQNKYLSFFFFPTKGK